ncbi:MAG: cytochrome-c peroxidase [Oligoflexales bacterium]
MLIQIFFGLSLIFSTNALSKNDYKKYFKDYQRPSSIPHPADNKYTTEREDLGKTLFFDPRLSGSDWISCGTCHNPTLSWGDGLPKGVGHGMKAVGRRTPTILNLAWGELMFWDGRSDSLEDQALGPIEAAGEMNLPIKELLVKLNGIPGYKDLFEKAYPGKGITKETIGKAIALYERTIVSGEAPFDRWLKGDETAISESAKKGFEIFNKKGECAVCHSGWRFTDDGFHDIGIAGDDKGRGSVLDVESLNYTFKTPTLRNVDHRAPYMHDGSEKTLEEVVDLYNKGGRVRRSTISDNVKVLGLNEKEKADLVAFMRTLTSKDKAVELPMMPRK